MSIARRDYILRMIEQLAEFVARIAGARREQKLELAMDEVGAALSALFGPLLSVLEGVDSPSAARLLGSPEKVRAYASLLAERAATHEVIGAAAPARVDYRRALELHLEAAAMGSAPDEAAREDIRALLTKIPESRLSDHHRRALEALEAADNNRSGEDP